MVENIEELILLSLEIKKLLESLPVESLPDASQGERYSQIQERIEEARYLLSGAHAQINNLQLELHNQ